MPHAKLSLKALEVFLAVSRRGIVRDASNDVGISVSTASHHLSELERVIGTPLFDHSRRPLRLTPAGSILRKRAEDAVMSLRKGLSEIWSGDLGALVRQLRFALIEDFDADVSPALAEAVMRAAPGCDVSFLSRPTHEILELLQSDQIDIGVATTADFDATSLHEHTVLKDPFVVVMPARAAASVTPEEVMNGQGDLPFLRYSARQLLGRRVEAQLRRMDLRFARRMEFETTHIILSLVAAGRGWTVTTALSFARAQRYHSGLRVLPFPGSAFARDISVFVREDVPGPVAALSVETIRNAIQAMILAPTVARYPWLATQFYRVETAGL